MEAKTLMIEVNLTEITCYEPDFELFNWMVIIIKDERWLPAFLLAKTNNALEAAKVKELKAAEIDTTAKVAINKKTTARKLKPVTETDDKV